MPDGRGLEIKYSFGDEQVRTAVYSEKRIGTFICSAAIGTLGLLGNFLHQDPSNPAPKTQTESKITLQAASLQSPVTTDETTTNSIPATKEKTQDRSPLSAQPIGVTTEASEPITQPTTSSKDHSSIFKPSEKVDIRLLQFTKTASTASGQIQWTVSMGLSNRTDGRVAGTVAAYYGDLRSPDVSYKMSRYVEKTLTLLIPHTVDSPRTIVTFEVRDEQGQVVGRLQHDLNSKKQPQEKRHSVHAGSINR